MMMMMSFSSSLFAYAVVKIPIVPFYAEGSARNLWRNKLITPQVGTPLRTFEIHERISSCAATLKTNNSVSLPLLDEDHQNHHRHHYNIDDIGIEHARILKEAKHVLMNKAREDDVVEALQMIDVIQTLGIEYHFEQEIQEALHKLHVILTSSHPPPSVSDPQGLYQVALHFRLLRQAGYNVPAEVFNKFKDEKGKIKEKYSEDIMGLIELYEASQLSVDGEHSLDEAGDMTHHLLHAWASQHHDNRLSEVISNTLKLPFHKSLPRFSNRSNYFQFQDDKEWTSTLKELAQVDSFVLKSIYQYEILQVTKWWKDLELGQDAKFSGFRPLKCYMWSMACFTDPSLSEQRIEITKPVSLIYIIDDIFDVYGTLEELTLFTDAVNRWELTGTEQLPEFMKIYLRVLFDTTNDFAEKIYKKHGLNPIDTLKKSWMKYLNAALEESQRLNSGPLPNTEEYLKSGIVTTGVHVFLVHAFFLLDHHHNLTKQVAIMNDFPNIIYSVAKILRFYDDLEGTMSEKQNGVDGSYLDCYMREHQDVSIGDAEKHVGELISREWKRLNQEMLNPNSSFPSSFTNFCLNAARMVPLMYHYSSNSRISNLEYHLFKSFLANVGTAHM